MNMQTIKSFMAIAIISAFSMSAQADSGVIDVQSAVTEPGTVPASIIIYRPKQSAHVKTINYRLYVDGESLGRLKTSSHHTVELAPGTHRISVHDKARSEYILSVGAGETLVIKALVSRTLGMNFTEMAPSAAVAEAPFVTQAIQAAVSPEGRSLKHTSAAL